MHSNIKVRTIVNIINLSNQYIKRIEDIESRCEHYKRIGDKQELMLAEFQLNREKSKYSEFLDFYV